MREFSLHATGYGPERVGLWAPHGAPQVRLTRVRLTTDAGSLEAKLQEFRSEDGRPPFFARPDGRHIHRGPIEVRPAEEAHPGDVDPGAEHEAVDGLLMPAIKATPRKERGSIAGGGPSGGPRPSIEWAPELDLGPDCGAAVDISAAADAPWLVSLTWTEGAGELEPLLVQTTDSPETPPPPSAEAVQPGETAASVTSPERPASSAEQAEPPAVQAETSGAWPVQEASAEAPAEAAPDTGRRRKR